MIRSDDWDCCVIYKKVQLFSPLNQNPSDVLSPTLVWLTICVNSIRMYICLKSEKIYDWGRKKHWNIAEQSYFIWKDCGAFSAVKRNNAVSSKVEKEKTTENDNRQRDNVQFKDKKPLTNKLSLKSPNDSIKQTGWTPYFIPRKSLNRWSYVKNQN